MKRTALVVITTAAVTAVIIYATTTPAVADGPAKQSRSWV